MQKKLISIIIPFYNRIALLDRAVNSVFEQTYEHWELILVNDNSSENIEYIKAINTGPLGQSIVLINNADNFGPGYSRNRGLDIASGEFVCFLDSDDIILPNFLSETCKVLREDLLFVYTTSCWENGDIYKTSDQSYNCVIPEILKFSRPWHTSSMLWNRKYLDKYDEAIFNWEDYLFELKSALKNNNIQHVPEILCVIGGVEESNLSSLENTERGLNDRIYALDKMFKYLKGSSFEAKALFYRLITIKYCTILLKVLSLKKNLNKNNLISELKYIPVNTFLLKLILKATKALD
jgi:glycosyltransferase involved in cell wall biosynthesis